MRKAHLKVKKGIMTYRRYSNFNTYQYSAKYHDGTSMLISGHILWA